MGNRDRFTELVSGRRRGLAAAGLRFFLRAAESPYTAAVRWRNHRFDQRRRSIIHAGIPVISVGNLTLGGTGKTPMVAWLAGWACHHHVRPVIISRGYGARRGQANDEARELARRLPDVRHIQNPDRVAAARQAVEQYDAQMILLDDGFQHRRLGRDLDIVLLDALEPFGFGHVFPRGMLREPVPGLARAGVVALSRSDMLPAEERMTIRAQALHHAPEAIWCELVHRPRALVGADGNTVPISALAGRRVAAFCGIGNPAGFYHTLRQCGYQLRATHRLADHHAYSAADLETLNRWAVQAGAEVAVCTEKDLVKIDTGWPGDVPLWSLSIELQVVVGRDSLERQLARLLAPAPSAASPHGTP